MVIDQYHMELLFLIAGAASFFSLNVRSCKSYTFERLKRLIVPLIFGMLVLVPPCYWVVAVHFDNYQGSFIEWYPTFLRDSLTPFQADYKTGALWFLWYLVLYTVILFPFFILIHRRFRHSLIAWLPGFWKKPGVLF
jgi:hypothetical protein